MKTGNRPSGMRLSRTASLRFVLCLALAILPACLVRRRTVVSPAARQTLPLLTASKEQLIQRLHGISDPIRSFLMTADLSPSILNPAKGIATDYATVSAYVLFQRPADIRVLAKDPVLGSTIFDMVSDGTQFRVSIPPKKRFIIGNDNAPETSGNKLENLRPNALLTSLMIYPPNPETDVTLLENDNERAVYILLIVRRDQNQFVLARQVYFDGRTLHVSRQKTFNAIGGIVSDTKYSDWKVYDGIPYPSGIDIQRLRDNYEVQLSVMSMRFNTPQVTPSKFVLEQPPDAELQMLK
ncbi:MAG TPA: hypothetical protein VME17_00075 [Bryobacteraceae bacterium]|nr:hypothetical protein [Bryobacteraceae bacterium]